MSRKASPTAIGAFVLGGIALVLAGLLVFGSGRFFKDTTTYVMYFEDSVTGLGLGAPVVFRGVKMGEVVSVAAEIDQELQIQIPVLVEIGGGVQPHLSGELAKLPRAELRKRAIPLLIDRGLRAQLGLQSVVTGQLHVALDFHPDTQVRYRGDGDLPEIPTIPSPLSQVRAKLESLPLEEIVTQALNVLESVDRIVGSPEMQEAVRNLNATLASARSLTDELEERVGPLADSAEEALSIAAHDSGTRYALENALVELGAAARSVRILAEYLERHPEALLAGKGGGQ
jgi:paraquat-inducible protein B